MGELKQSDICTGYGLGPGCVNCCVIDATVCHRNREFEKNFDVFFFLNMGKWDYDNGIYSQRSVIFFILLVVLGVVFKTLVKDISALRR